MDRVERVHQDFLRRVSANAWPEAGEGPSLADSGLAPGEVKELFASQALSRHLDRTARAMQGRGEGFYTIASSGHEGMAAIAAAFRVNDMAFLHYRDAAFFIHRARTTPGQDPMRDLLLSFAASADDPISGGRHKVLGSKALFIPPQTSTIASHMPKAAGAAFSIPLARRLRPQAQQMPDDAVILCSFGDASLNHSTAQGAINSACWTAFQGMPVPLVWICEDNGIGISVKTPPGWIEASMKDRAGLTYIPCDGLNVLDVYRAAREAEHCARVRRKPAFVHLRCVRLFGHAGSDVESGYLTNEEIEANEANDPLLHTARILVDNTIATPREVVEMYTLIGAEVEAAARELVDRPKLETADDVMASLVPPPRPIPDTPAKRPSAQQRDELFGADLKAMETPQTLSRVINWTLADLMLEHPEIILAGEDVGPKGGVYGVTNKLHARFGPSRVLNTILDEQTILGLAIGLSHNGFLPIPEIQFLAYLHNAEDQVRGEAATLSFFSNGQFTNPMVIRIAGLGYQKGFGGHFHNDNAIAVLRDIPGLIIACPSNPADAPGMLRECVRLAREEQRVVVFLEPIALYPMRDVHKEGDAAWAKRYAPPGQGAYIQLGNIGQFGAGEDLAILTYGNGYYLSRQAERVLVDLHDIQARVIDLRWLAPLPEAEILEAVRPCASVLIVDECRASGSPSEALFTLMAEKAGKAWVTRRVTARDSFIPLGKAASVTLPNRNQIIDAAVKLARR